MTGGKLDMTLLSKIESPNHLVHTALTDKLRGAARGMVKQARSKFLCQNADSFIHSFIHTVDSNFSLSIYCFIGAISKRC
jgi:hypothetical protein